MSTTKSILKFTISTNGLSLPQLLNLIYFSNNHGNSQILSVISLISKDSSCLNLSIFENDKNNKFEFTFAFDDPSTSEKYAGFLI